MDAFVATVDRDNPWPGLASYDEAAQAYFSGRGAETTELVRRIGDDALTVLFGKSGLGKSSLLKAGVFPVLRQRGFLPVPVRLQFGPGAPDAIEQIASALFAAFDAERIEYPPRAGDESLWEYLHRADLRFWTPKVRPIQPVLVLDQFEEVFTLGRAAPGIAEALRERLADLAENRIPATLAARVEAGAALSSVLDVHAQPYKLVLSLREDFLPDLEGWVAAMPSLRRNRMRLLPLQRGQALQAVCNAHTEHLVDAALARRIVDYLASGTAAQEAAGSTLVDAEVEPALLSLVCRGINEARKRAGVPRFDDALFEAGKGRIVADFYIESVADQPETVRAFIETELVTDQGYRNSYSLAQALASGRATREQVATLVERRLLRIEHHLGAERVELTHDLLAAPVLAGRKARTEARWAQRVRRTRQKWTAIASSLVAALAVLALLLHGALRSRDEANAARDEAYAARVETKKANDLIVDLYLKGKVQADEIDRKASEATASASAARAAEARASEAGAQARLEAGRALTEAARADQASRLARSREVAARAAAVVARDRELAMLLAREALRIADTPEAREALLEAALYAWPSTELSADQVGGRPTLVGLDAAGRQLVVVATNDKQVRLGLWDIGTRAPTQARWQRSFDQASEVGFVVFARRKDRRLLLIGRPGGVDQLDADTGEPAAPQIALPPGAQREAPVQLAVSRDERWLAAALPSGATLIHDFDDPVGGWETVATSGAGAISIADDGQAIAMVAAQSLQAAVVERAAGGQWARRPIDLASCARPQSVSPAASYAVATWSATACSVALAPGERPASSLPSHSGETIADTVASASGATFVAILSNGDLEVGAGDPSHPEWIREIKGVQLAATGNMLSDVSVDDAGTRVAWLRDGKIHVVSLDAKPLVAEVAPGTIQGADGRHIVQARAAGHGAVMWMTPIAAVSEGRELPRPTWSVALPALPSQLKVLGDSVFVGAPVEGGKGLAFTVHDIDSGAVRAGPFVGSAAPVGREGRLLLLRPPSGHAAPAGTRLIRVADGQVLEQWDENANLRVVLSQARTALLVVRRTEDAAHAVVAQALSVRADRLEPAGRVVDLPMAAAAVGALSIDDAATWVTERGAFPAAAASGASAPAHRDRLRWPLVAGRDTSARDPAAAAGLSTEVASPGGSFVMREERQQEGGSATVLVRRGSDAVIQRFGAKAVAFRFSDDERWLGYLDSGTLQVLDLQTLQPLLAWSVPRAQSLEFAHSGNLLRVGTFRGDLWIPLDRTLLDGFARWLVARDLSSRERCDYGLAPTLCSTARPRTTASEVATAGPR